MNPSLNPKIGTSSPLKIFPLGGLGEIGMNCMLIETETSAVLVDCGLMFSDLDHFGVEFVVPNFKLIFDRREKIKGIILTHGHEDHIGALSFLLKSGIRAPLYASHFTALMIRERLEETGLSDAVPMNILTSGVSVELGDFKVTPVAVNHSIIDAMGLIIDTPIGKIVHTGDFKCAPTAYVGDVMAWELFQKSGDDGVLLLMSDSTNVERDYDDVKEADIADRMVDLLSQARGMTVVTLFSSNVGRLANIIQAGLKTGKKIAITGRSMQQNLRLAMERRAFSMPAEALIPIEDVRHFDRKDVLVLSTGCQGEYRSALNRMAREEHAHVTLTDQDLVIFSSSQIPGNEKEISRLLNDLFRCGSEVVYSALDDVHSSGHATRPELKRVLETVKPKFFLPVHGEFRHLVKHAELALETGVREENILVAENGEVLELTPDRFAIVDKFEDLRVLVQDREGSEIPRALLKDRKKLAETGAVVSLLAREKESGRVLTKPEVILKGAVPESFEEWFRDEAQGVVQDVLTRYKRDLKKGDFFDLEEEVRIELRRFFERQTGKKPTVISLVMDV